MNVFMLASFALFVFWALSVVRIDMATNKIPNTSLVTGLKLMAVCLAAVAANTLMGSLGRSEDYLKWLFYPMWGMHVLWSILVGVVLWYSEIWPAGDAKFFIVVSAWLPVINPVIKRFPNGLFMSLLVNIFVVGAFVAGGGFIASGFYKAGPAEFLSKTWRDVKIRLKAMDGGKVNKWYLPLYLINVTFVFLMQQLLSLETRLFLNGIISRTDVLFFLMFFLWGKTLRLFKSKVWFYTLAFGYSAYFCIGYLYFPAEFLWLLRSALENVFKFSLVLFVGRVMMEFLMEKKDATYVGGEDLRPGMILSSESAAMLKSNSLFNGMFDDCFKDGLTQEQVVELRAWLKNIPGRDGKAQVEIIQGKPFALWIFVGAVITLIFDKNLAILVK